MTNKRCTCVYCAHSEPYFSTDMQEVGRVRGLMIAHDRVCPKNPLVAEITALLSRLAAAEQKYKELDLQWRNWGIIEVAIRNPSVSDYMNHWEGRAEKAEARVRELSEENNRLATLVAEYRGDGYLGQEGRP